jgi:quinol monooxygenase YgiN
MSDIVVVTALIDVRPDAVDAAVAVLETAITATHGEAGCISYALHRDVEDPARFVIVEKWASADALTEHAQTPHLKQLFTDLGPLLAAPPTIVRTTPVPIGEPGGKGLL